jgi:hypothetical protein
MKTSVPGDVEVERFAENRCEWLDKPCDLSELADCPYLVTQRHCSRVEPKPTSPTGETVDKCETCGETKCILKGAKNWTPTLCLKYKSKTSIGETTKEEYKADSTGNFPYKPYPPLGETVLTEYTKYADEGFITGGFTPEERWLITKQDAHTRSDLIKQGWKSPEEVAAREDCLADAVGSLAVYRKRLEEVAVRLEQIYNCGDDVDVVIALRNYIPTLNTEVLKGGE